MESQVTNSNEDTQSTVYFCD